MNKIADRVLGPALGLPVVLGLLACPQLLDGQALLCGLADTRGGRALCDPGSIERAPPVKGRLFRSSLQDRCQSLAIAFALESMGGDRRGGRGRAALRFLLQGLARLFSRAIQLLLFLFSAQVCRCGFAQGSYSLFLCAAAQAEQGGQVGCHGCSGDVASGDG